MNQLKLFRHLIPLYFLERDDRVSQKNRSKLFKRNSMNYTFFDNLYYLRKQRAQIRSTMFVKNS